MDAVLAALPGSAASLRPVLNATGVLVHTNLGRAPLSAAAVEAVVAAAGTTDVELDLDTGRRGPRGEAALAALLAAVPAAEAALVVGNCAAALALVATALGQGRELVLARGELVEIGDGFRIPELLESTGARIREVGTTNRVTVGRLPLSARPGHRRGAQGAPEQLRRPRVHLLGGGVRAGGRTGRHRRAAGGRRRLRAAAPAPRAARRAGPADDARRRRGPRAGQRRQAARRPAGRAGARPRRAGPAAAPAPALPGAAGGQDHAGRARGDAARTRAPGAADAGRRPRPAARPGGGGRRPARRGGHRRRGRGQRGPRRRGRSARAPAAERRRLAARGVRRAAAPRRAAGGRARRGRPDPARPAQRRPGGRRRADRGRARGGPPVDDDRHGRRRDRRPRRPRQVLAGARAHRHGARPLGRGAPPRADHRPRLRLDDAAVGPAAGGRRRARARAVHRQHAGRHRLGARRAGRRGRRRRLVGADRGARRRPRRARGAARAARRHQGRPRRPRARARRRARAAGRAPRWARCRACAVSSVTGDGVPEVAAALETPAGRAARARPRTPRCGCGWTARSPSAAPAPWSPARSRRAAWPPATGCSWATARSAVRAVQSLGAPVERARATARVALNLRGVAVEELARGDALLTPGAFRTTDELDVTLDAVPEDRLPAEAVLHVGSAAVGGAAAPAGGDGGAAAADRAAAAAGRRPGAAARPRRPPGARRRRPRRRPARSCAAAARPGRRAAELADSAPAARPARPPTWPAAGWSGPTSSPRWAGRCPRAPTGSGRGCWPRGWSRSWPAGCPTSSPGTGGCGRWSRGRRRTWSAAPSTCPTPSWSPRWCGRRWCCATAGCRRRRPRCPDAVQRAVDDVRARLAGEPFAAPEVAELAAAGLGPRELGAAVRSGQLVRIAEGVYLAPGRTRRRPRGCGRCRSRSPSARPARRGGPAGGSPSPWPRSSTPAASPSGCRDGTRRLR